MKFVTCVAFFSFFVVTTTAANPSPFLIEEIEEANGKCTGDCTVCRGPYYYKGKNNKVGTCCNANVGDSCRECKKITGKCAKCQLNFALKDGKCFKKCTCREKNRGLGKECCPRCANPCKPGLDCVQQGAKNRCIIIKKGPEGEYEYGHTSSPSRAASKSTKPTKRPSKKISQKSNKPTLQPTSIPTIYPS